MIGGLLKLGVMVVFVLILLNIFAPQQADKILSVFSEKTALDKDGLKEKLDKATEFTKDTAKEATQTVQKSLEK